MREIPHVKPESCQPLSYEEFEFAFALAMQAGYLKVPVYPRAYGVNLQEGDGSVSRLVLTDIPENRAAIAVKQHFGEEYEKFQSFMWRFFALIDILHDPRAAGWIEDDPDDPEAQRMAVVVVNAAATVPLNKQGKFLRKRFFAEAIRLEQGEEAAV